VTSTLSGDAKDALAREIPSAEHCRSSLRDALYYYGRAPRGSGFRTQRASVARLAWTLLDDRKAHPVQRTRAPRLRRASVFAIERAPVELPARRARCDRRMELRAAFLACGSIAAPARGYHLEFVPPNEAAAARLLAALRAEGRAPKVARRKGRSVVYFKGVDEIAQLLTSIGAFAAVLRLEDQRALKETKNRIRRLVNTDAANVDRAVNAAAVQREAIALVADAYGLGKLSRPLRRIAELRLAHPTESLLELGRRCDPPASKSTVNGRIAALVRLARTVRRA
jgi:DNA-binding transcriptional regulator WhiA